MIELRTLKFVSLAAETGKFSFPDFAELPIIEYSVLAAICIALALCVVLLALYCWSLRKAAAPPRKIFRVGQKIGDIAYSAELAQVGPAQPDIASEAFHDSIHALALSSTEVLKRHDGKSIAISSASTGMGVSTIAVALARDLANQGLRTLLLDMNFVSPMVQQATGTFSIHGISNYLMSGLIDDITVPDTNSPLDIIGVGNVPVPIFQTFLLGGEFKDGLLALMVLYDRVVIDCPPLTDANTGILRIAEQCDLRLLLVDAQLDSTERTCLQKILRTHRAWKRGITLLLRNKVQVDTHSADVTPIPTIPVNSGFRPLQAEAWIIRQPDTLYTLKLTELNYRPILTKHQLAIYAGHQVACFRLTILGKPNYLLILGQFRTRSEAMSTAQTLGLTQPSVMAVTFATVKQGIKHERNRKSKSKAAPADALSD